MASLFDLLRDTMPIAAAEYTARWPDKPFDNLELGDVWPRIRYLLPGEDYEARVPSVSHPEVLDDPTPSDELVKAQRLWGWKHKESDPATITDVTCRVRHARYRSFVVLNRIQFGYEDPEKLDFRPVVKVTMANDDIVELPLTSDFVDSRWVVFAGYLPDDGCRLWPIESRLDNGLVVAFVYELGTDNTPKRWRDVPPKTPKESSDLEEMEKAARELSGPHLKGRSASSEGGATNGSIPISELRDGPGPIKIMELPLSWGERIRLGELMPSADQSAVGGSTPSTPSASVGAARIVVFLTLSTFCERFDFDPGGLGGVAKIFPHIMIQSNVPLKLIEATVRMDRPSTTTDLDNPIGDGPKTCCNPPYDIAKPEIKTLLVTDYNNNPNWVVPTAMWGNIFAYYEPEGFPKFGSTPLHVVRKDRPGQREDDGLVDRDFGSIAPGSFDIFNLDPSTKLEKAPRQGEFDNVHVAPRLKLVNVTDLGFGFPLGDDRITIDDAMRERLKLDDIAMAPICAHDCFHMHWRWTPKVDAKWVFGWDENGPYRAAGAPMVPLNQDVFVTLRSAYELSYHVVVGSDMPSIPEGEWQVIMHHGAGYPSFVNRGLQFLATFTADLATAASPAFFDSTRPVNGVPNRLSAIKSTALFYWSIRYYAEYEEGSVRLVERVRANNLNGARDL